MKKLILLTLLFLMTLPLLAVEAKFRVVGVKTVDTDKFIITVEYYQEGELKETLRFPADAQDVETPKKLHDFLKKALNQTVKRHYQAQATPTPIVDPATFVGKGVKKENGNPPVDDDL